MHADESGLNDCSQRVIGGAFAVLNVLGAGFLEKVYENALAHELRKAGLPLSGSVALQLSGSVALQ